VIFGGKKKGVTKTKAAKVDDQSDITAIGNVELAFLSGQFTRDSSADADLLIVGDVNHTKAQKYITDLEQSEGKEIRFALMTVKEFEYRQQVKDRFITSILASKKQVLIDKNKILEK